MEFRQSPECLTSSQTKSLVDAENLPIACIGPDITDIESRVEVNKAEPNVTSRQELGKRLVHLTTGFLPEDRTTEEIATIIDHFFASLAETEAQAQQLNIGIGCRITTALGGGGGMIIVGIFPPMDRINFKGPIEHCMKFRIRNGTSLSTGRTTRIIG